MTEPPRSPKTFQVPSDATAPGLESMVWLQNIAALILLLAPDYEY